MVKQIWFKCLYQQQQQIGWMACLFIMKTINQLKPPVVTTCRISICWTISWPQGGYWRSSIQKATTPTTFRPVLIWRSVYISKLIQLFFGAIFLFESWELLFCSFHCRLRSSSFLRCFWAAQKFHVSRFLKHWRRTIGFLGPTLKPGRIRLRWRSVKRWYRQKRAPSNWSDPVSTLS